MKALVRVASGMLLLSVSPTSGQDWSLQTPQLRQAVYKLESKVADAEVSAHCSAVLINEKEDIVVTAGHCVPEKAEGRSVAVDEKHASVVKHNTVLDLAVLKVEGLHGHALPVRKEDIASGLPVMFVGYGFAAEHVKLGF